MKLAVSNIGWAPEAQGEVLPHLREGGVEGVVIAPTMVFEDGPYAPHADVAAFAAEVQDSGLAVVGLQSLTFGLKDASLFGEEEERRRLTEHLKQQADLAGRLGATSLIFGSPGLRQAYGDGDRDRALEVFGAVAPTAADNNAVLCIEPLSGYGNRFVVSTGEGIDLVRQVDHPGFGLHLDAAAIAGFIDHPMLAIPYAQGAVGIRSFDASAPDLKPLTDDITVDHEVMAAALNEAGYEGFVSLEMRQPEDIDPIAVLFKQIAYMREQYAEAA